jgi:hypothetical protein
MTASPAAQPLEMRNTGLSCRTGQLRHGKKVAHGLDDRRACRTTWPGGLSKRPKQGGCGKLNEQPFSRRHTPAVDSLNHHIKNGRQKQGRSLAHMRCQRGIDRRRNIVQNFSRGLFALDLGERIRGLHYIDVGGANNVHCSAERFDYFHFADRPDVARRTADFSSQHTRFGLGSDQGDLAPSISATRLFIEATSSRVLRARNPSNCERRLASQFATAPVSHVLNCAFDRMVASQDGPRGRLIARALTASEGALEDAAWLRTARSVEAFRETGRAAGRSLRRP